MSQRTRLIFQNVSLFTGPAATSGWTATGAHYIVPGTNAPANTGNNLIADLANITSTSLSVGVNREDLNVFGMLNRRDQIILSPPSIQLSFGYNSTDGYNEKMLGFDIKGNSFLSGILTKESDSKNYFVAISKQGVDAIGDASPVQRDVLAVGNGFISNYSLSAAVGRPVTSSVTVDALNVVAYTGASGNYIPAVNPLNSARNTSWTFQLPTSRAFTGDNSLSALRPGDITINFPNGAGFLVPLNGSEQVNLQSFDIAMPISRNVTSKLGAPLGFSREIQFPLNCQLSLRALQTELVTGSFDQLYCNDTFSSATIKIRKPSCPGTLGNDAINLAINQFKVDNISFGYTVGGDATVDLSMSAQLAGALSTNGITFSGAY